MKKLLSISICFVLFCTCRIYAADVNKMVLNGEVMTFSVDPIIENQTTLFPMRDIFEALGATVTWNSEDQSVFAVKDDISIWLQQGNLLAGINDKQITLPVAPKIVNGRMLVPIRVIIETIGGKVETRIEMIWPIPGFTKESMNFGRYFNTKVEREILHTGISIPAPEGTPIVAVANGKVIFANELGGYGNMVLIDHGNGIVTLYAQCSELLVKEDSQVKTGDEIAKSGSTGNATGPCLYFEVREKGEPVNPNKYLTKQE